MDKLKMHTPDLTAENFRKLAELFPNAVTETIDENGKVVRAIDADVLRQEISAEVVEGMQERYQFTWPDKKRSVILANQPIAKTLRLVREKSVGRDGTPGSIDTENVYIEGDNLDALKLLQETYLGKVKMIYIDPPYNTGNDFIYEDDFSQDADEYLAGSGQYDEEGNRLVQNTESNGRFHTDWLNMLYPRLRIAKDLLSNDGVIFISIDDNEVMNLRKICDEVFGCDNFVANIIIENDSRIRPYDSLSITHEYVLFYRKSEQYHSNLLLNPNKKFQFTDSEGGFDLYELRNRNSDFNIGNRPNLYYPFWVNPESCDENGLYELSLEPRENWIKFYPQESQGIKTVWRWSKEKSLENLNKVIFGKRTSGGWQVVKKYRDSFYSLSSVWKGNDFSSDKGTLEFKSLFNKKRVFTFPKPINLIKQVMLLTCGPDDLILDFFSGSATTAHAVMQHNSEDGGHRRFLLVQLPEVTDEKSEARKAGFSTICDIGEERIRRSGKKIREESPLTTGDLDIGFRVFRIDSTNMKDVYYRPQDFKQGQFKEQSDNVKEDRTPEDLLFQVMLDLGIPLSSKIEETVIEGKKVFFVPDRKLIACFDKEITDKTVKAIAKKHPDYAIFRDGGINGDSVMTNFEQIFETYSPRTRRKVL